MNRSHLTINVRGELMDFGTPKVMGILNVTPDSFYAASRKRSIEEVRERVIEMLAEEVDIIDIGACSTRPGSEAPPADVEMERLAMGLAIIRDLSEDIPVSVDTFRSEIARKCVEEWGADIINDIGGGSLDPEMWSAVEALQVPYVLSHIRGLPYNMTDYTSYQDVTAEVIVELVKKLDELRLRRVNDVIIDPGFGFAKTLKQNFQLLSELEEFCKIGAPLLVGVSRKSMIYKILDITPDESLTGSVSLETAAISKGADIIRVHDVKAAKEMVKLMKFMSETKGENE